jgi:hypothetical protein
VLRLSASGEETAWIVGLDRWMIKISIGEFQWLKSTYPEHVRRVQYDQIPSELVLVLLNKLPGS